MKKYIIFANSISGIGGAQLYILRKINYLLKNAYDPYLIVGDAASIKHAELNQFHTMELQELFFPPNLYSHKKRSEFTSKIKKFINYSDTDIIFIESHQTGPALWGEIFAQSVNSFNFIYALAPFRVKRKVYERFFYNKLKEELFLGCNESFIKTNFPNWKGKNNYFNIPFNKSEIINMNHPYNVESNFDLEIFTVSRIDKKYINSSISELIEYASKNKNIRIKYDIYINVTSGAQYDKMNFLVNSNKNENLLLDIKQPVSTLNSSLYMGKDLFVGMGTAILNAASMKIPSLVVDYRNNNCYGFFGKEHMQFGYTEKAACRSFYSYIESFINEAKKDELGEKGYLLFCSDFENEVVNNKFIDYIEGRTKSTPTFTDIPVRIFDLIDLGDFFLKNLFGEKKALNIRGVIISKITRFRECIVSRKLDS